MSRNRNAPFGSALLGPAGQPPRRLRIRLQLLLTGLLVSTHLIGAAVVFAISVFVLPTEPINRASVIALAISVPVYVAASVLLGGLWGTITGLRATRWATEERQPSVAERRRTLRLPLRLTLMQSVLWTGGLVLFTLEAIVLQPGRVLGVAFAVGISGLVVSGISYLLAEFALRPIAARALAGGHLDRTGAIGVAGRMLLFWAIGTAAPVAGLAVAAVVALAGEEMSRQRLAVIALALCLVVLVFGLMVTVLNARAVVAPIGTVRQALDDVGAGRFDTEVAVFDGTELGLLQAGFNDMVRGLREREALRDMFGRHVGRDVAEAAAAADVALGGETRVVSVLFIDLIGSTGYASDRDPQEVVATLNEFFGVVVAEVDRHRGLVNKFMGDAALAVFGAPLRRRDHPALALACAREIARRLAVEVPQISAGIGVATGPAVAGNIGDESRFEYTVIGDSVNSAARLCELAKDEPGLVLATADAVAAAGPPEREHWEAAGTTTLRGRASGTELARPILP